MILRARNSATADALGETPTPGRSALFVVVRKTNPKQIDQLLDRIKPFAGRGKILQCNMPAENEVLLRNLLEAEVSRLSSAVPTFTASKP